MPKWKCGAPDCLGHIHPSHKCDSRYITRNLWVYVFPDAQLAAQVYAHVFHAVDIWKSAGIQFLPAIMKIDDKLASQLLCGERSLRVNIGRSVDLDEEPGRTQRQNLYRLKKQPWALAVFFVNANVLAKADPDHFQVYMSNDLVGARAGRTLAHEIGHILLGEGHNENVGCGEDSGLMYAGNQAGGTREDISTADSKKARDRARRIAFFP
jgi:hypothetical protein